MSALLIWWGFHFDLAQQLYLFSGRYILRVHCNHNQEDGPGQELCKFHHKIHDKCMTLVYLKVFLESCLKVYSIQIGRLEAHQLHLFVCFDKVCSEFHTFQFLLIKKKKINKRIRMNDK